LKSLDGAEDGNCFEMAGFWEIYFTDMAFDWKYFGLEHLGNLLGYGPIWGKCMGDAAQSVVNYATGDTKGIFFDRTTSL